jgi:serine/threonine protein kinase
MTRQETDYALLDRLASEFAARVRTGQRPSVEEYCARHPEVAADLREVLPPLAGLVAARELLDAPPPPVVRHEKRLGDYLLLREIGRGGMGVVYEAEQVSLGRRVAIKLLPAYASSPDLAARFEREARTAGRLHHTNIVPVFGVGRDGGTLFYVMQFIPGHGLDAVVADVRRLRAGAVPTAEPAPADARTTPHGRLAPPDSALTELPPPDGSTAGFNEEGQAYWRSVARVGVQVADALDYAHKQGVLHRDIKPSNLLLDPAGTVWVTDFGLAKAAGQESLTADGALLGTLRYLPPEGLAGRADARSDVYSLGLTLYELAALRPAFPETDRNVLIQQIDRSAPAWVTASARGIPRDLATVIHKAIVREPNRRYPTAAALAADLRRFLDGKPVRARWVGPVERAVRWCRRYPAQTALMAGLGLLATTSVAAGLSAANDHRHLGHTEDQWAAAEVKAEQAAARADAAEAGGRLSRAVLFAADGRRDAAARELAGIDPGRRGWEWQYCDALADGRATRRVVPPAAGGRTFGFAVRADDLVRAVAAADGLRIERDGGVKALEPVDPTGGLMFDAAGDRLALATPTGVTVVDVESGAEVVRLPADVRPTAPVVLSADGARVGVVAGDAFGVWTVHDGKPLLRRSVPGVRFAHLALSGDGRLLAAAGTRTVRVGGREVRDQFLGVWNVESGNERPAPAPPADAVTSLAFDPTGARLAWVAGPGRVGVWDANRGRHVAAWDAEGNVDALAFAPDGRRLACVSAGVVRLWDAATGPEVFALPAAGGEPGARLRFGEDGRSLAVGAEGGPLTAWSFVVPLEKLGPPRPGGE